VCPQCGAPVVRAHRRLRDRIVSIFHDVRRYRCRAADCGWQGLLRQSTDARSSRTGFARARAVLIVLGVSLMSLVGVSAAVYWNGMRAMPAPLAAGTSTAGVPLAPDDPRGDGDDRSKALRRGCVWGGPGESPYLGTIAAALTAARVPDDVVRKIEILREGRIVGDRVEISSDGIGTPDHRRYFGHTVSAMALGDVLCFSTRVNVPADMIVSADLYELLAENGSRFTIMVVAQGGQVAVLDEQTRR
jgi:hypothetical protein